MLGVVDEIWFEAKLVKRAKSVDSGSGGSSGPETMSQSRRKTASEQDRHFITGLSDYMLDVKEHIK